MPQIWLMKTEPDVFSIDDLAKVSTTLWEGVRNYQARNFMTQTMKDGDTVLFYHSNAEPSGIVGLGKIQAPAVPDPTQFNKKSEYFDPKASKENQRWFCVRVQFVAKFEKMISLSEIKNHPILSEMLVAQRGQRLSIQPVAEKHFAIIQQLQKSTRPLTVSKYEASAVRN